MAEHFYTEQISEGFHFQVGFQSKDLDLLFSDN